MCVCVCVCVCVCLWWQLGCSRSLDTSLLTTNASSGLTSLPTLSTGHNHHHYHHHHHHHVLLLSLHSYIICLTIITIIITIITIIIRAKTKSKDVSKSIRLVGARVMVKSRTAHWSVTSAFGEVIDIKMENSQSATEWIKALQLCIRWSGFDDGDQFPAVMKRTNSEPNKDKQHASRRSVHRAASEQLVSPVRATDTSQVRDEM